MHSKIGIVIQRILFGAFTLAFLTVIFLFDRFVAQWALGVPGLGGELLRRGSVVPFFFAVVLFLGAMEMNRLLLARGFRPFTMASCLMTVVLFLLPWLAPAGLLGDSIADRERLYWPLAGVAMTLLAIGTLCVLRKNPTGTIQDGGATLLTVLYLGFLGSFGLQLRCGLNAPQWHGVWLLLIVILVTKCSDIGGYLVGSCLGRHKLIPSVSPGKSVEGAIGGLLGSGLAAVLLSSTWVFLTNPHQGTQAHWVWFEMARAFGDAFTGSGLAPAGQAFLFGVLLSGAAQIGDLFESCFKRDADIKDSGSIMPHYGGILDLVDSPLFALPVAWFLLTRVWNIP